LLSLSGAAVDSGGSSPADAAAATEDGGDEQQHDQMSDDDDEDDGEQDDEEQDHDGEEGEEEYDEDGEQLHLHYDEGAGSASSQSCPPSPLASLAMLSSSADADASAGVITGNVTSSGRRTGIRVTQQQQIRRRSVGSISESGRAGRGSNGGERDSTGFKRVNKVSAAAGSPAFKKRTSGGEGGSAGGSSCHQCKSRRAYGDLTYCTSSLGKKNKNAICRKKFCEHVSIHCHSLSAQGSDGCARRIAHRRLWSVLFCFVLSVC
jgi:hypothetical protein